MTSTEPPVAKTIGESLTEINKAFANFGREMEKAVGEAMDRWRRTVSLVLPHPTETAGQLAVWTGEGWRVELVGDQIRVTGGCAIGETEQVAAAMLAADRIRGRRAAGDPEADQP